ncbi:DUF2281 domain-containing protein [Nodosilinea sp. P-1105]|uniref:type II toxin-antitoxin system VapB family antitoxin n=1 Tax=Nodosilinea sp. P-1105 TaxID=2546229 RepID=UPI00146C1F4E|nr:DUF2281 domain-containing protein [Nodosilinea sp. P-1105]NMF83252.1 DUF2281 domain-containing protein [Nodosilinea sp. P-1105]
MIQPFILEKLEALPESLQNEVLHYIEFLSEKYTRTDLDTLKNLSDTFRGLTEAEAEKQYGYGSMVGQIIIADDFDEPLEELADYM